MGMKTGVPGSTHATEPIHKISALQLSSSWLAGKFKNETKPYLKLYFEQKICWEFCKISIVASKIKFLFWLGNQKKRARQGT